MNSPTQANKQQIGQVLVARRSKQVREYFGLCHKTAPAMGYLTIPTFTTNSVFEVWPIFDRQFNFTVSKSFTIMLPVIANVSFTPGPDIISLTGPTIAGYITVKWRVGETVYRYRIWDNVPQILTYVPAYNSEIIPKNFSIEVWSYDISATVMPEFYIMTSFRQRTVEDISTYNVATGTVFAEESFSLPETNTGGVLTNYNSGMQWITN